MTYNKCSIQPLLTCAIIFLSLCRLSFEVCTVNQWCRPPTNVSASEYKFVVQTSGEHMNWFEALQLCRNEGGGTELFSLESATEREWLRSQLESFAPEIGVLEENADGALLWLVNAHLYLYHRDALAWATGRPIDESMYREVRGASLPVRRTIPVRNCSGIRGGVEAECFAISVTRQISGGSGRDRQNIMLVDVHCTDARAFRAICKRPRDPKPPNTSTSKYRFVASQWIRSPTDSTLYYRILNLEQDCHQRSNWYCARLLCMRHEASLTDIEDFEEYEWLKERIADSFTRERASGGTAYFVDLHRYLYNTDTWTWGGPPKERSFIQSLPEHVSQDPCEQQLCARIRYAVGANERIELGAMYCGGKTWQSRAVCKKRVVAPTTSSAIEDRAVIAISSSTTNDNFSLPIANWFTSLEMLSMRYRELFTGESESQSLRSQSYLCCSCLCADVDVDNRNSLRHMIWATLRVTRAVALTGTMNTIIIMPTATFKKLRSMPIAEETAAITSERCRSRLEEVRRLRMRTHMTRFMLDIKFTIWRSIITSSHSHPKRIHSTIGAGTFWLTWLCYLDDLHQSFLKACLHYLHCAQLCTLRFFLFSSLCSRCFVLLPFAASMASMCLARL